LFVGRREEIHTSDAKQMTPTLTRARLFEKRSGEGGGKNKLPWEKGRKKGKGKEKLVGKKRHQKVNRVRGVVAHIVTLLLNPVGIKRKLKETRGAWVLREKEERGISRKERVF